MRSQENWGGSGGGNYPWKVGGHDVVSVTLTGTAGSAPSGTYNFIVCSASPTDLWLITPDNIGTANWATQCAYRWTASIASGIITDSAITITDVQIPSIDDFNNHVKVINNTGTTRLETSSQHTNTNYSWQYEGGTTGYGKGNAVGIYPLIHISG